jgi:hypothetical protein
MYQGPNQWLSKLRLDGLLDLSKDAANGPKVLLRVQVKTADYTVLPADSGTIFTTYGDTGAIVFTLPAVPTVGMFFLFFQSTNQNMSINSAAANGIIGFNDLDADGVTAVTGSGLIGALFLVFADGNIWNAACISNGTTQTVTT